MPAVTWIEAAEKFSSCEEEASKFKPQKKIRIPLISYGLTNFAFIKILGESSA